MKKQIIMARILEFGGNNAYLKTLIRYFGEENVILLLKRKEDLAYISKIDPEGKIEVLHLPGLRDSVNFKKHAFLHNLKELYYLLNIFRRIFLLNAKHGFGSLTISAIHPEKYLYFLWMPFINVKYILHSEPRLRALGFTTLTCNIRLGKRKKIITVSNYNKDAIISQWQISKRKAKNIFVVYNCIAGEPTLFEQISPQTKLPDSNRKMVLTMGHVSDYKNPEVWLAVARRITKMRKNVLFYWLGNGPLLNDYRHQVKHNDNILFAGLIDNPYPYLEKTTVYYQPSLIETQGIAVIEAMSHHVPCVVSDAGGLPESVENNRSGYVVSATLVEEHVNKILSLLDDENLCKSFGENSFMLYKKLFLFDSFRKRMNEIYGF